MRDYLTLGPTPAAEDCAQVGADDYERRSRREARAYIHQLERTFPRAAELGMFGSKTFPHDFGSYREVVVRFDDENQEELDLAFQIEATTPSDWDEEAC